jgi:hypothetical protein
MLRFRSRPPPQRPVVLLVVCTVTVPYAVLETSRVRYVRLTAGVHVISRFFNVRLITPSLLAAVDE